MHFQTYFDDSGSHNDSEYYVMSGILATEDRWKLFNGEWTKCISKEPPIEYFKMSEAKALKGQFSSFTPSLRDQKVLELAEITERHAVAGISAIVARNDFDRYISRATHFRELENPYWFLFYQAITLTLDFMNKLDKHTNTDVSDFKIDFIFDEQGIIGREALEWWAAFEQVIDDPRRRFLNSIPIFGSDRNTLPLQAADLYAWHARHVFGGGDDSVRTRVVAHTLHKITPYGWMVTGDEMAESLPELIEIAERHR